ncbi:hypothetical protein RKD19_001575 [Streptomyces canus]
MDEALSRDDGPADGEEPVQAPPLLLAGVDDGEAEPHICRGID